MSATVAPLPTGAGDADKSTNFSAALLTWFDHHGRKDLPWQQDPTTYRVWVSEVMLQQTQVSTVIPYFQRFMTSFPDISSLAASSIDEVLLHWSGLGYYARARNLHKTAQSIQENHHGKFPGTLPALQALPGIGRSTAAAILALSANQCHAILDGNVKRVLSRFHTIEGWPGTPVVARQLWALAEQHTPSRRVADYTQAIMDLGATICTRSNPQCMKCPLTKTCQACLQQRVNDYPSPRARRNMPYKTTTMIILLNQAGEVLLVKRPPTGIWGGLWSLPEYTRQDRDSKKIRAWCRSEFGCGIEIREQWPAVRHSFTHFHLTITPLVAHSLNREILIMEGANHVWYNVEQPETHAMATPVRRLLEQLQLAKGELT